MGILIFTNTDQGVGGSQAGVVGSFPRAKREVFCDAKFYLFEFGVKFLNFGATCLGLGALYSNFGAIHLNFGKISKKSLFEGCGGG